MSPPTTSNLPHDSKIVSYCWIWKHKVLSLKAFFLPGSNERHRGKLKTKLIQSFAVLWDSTSKEVNYGSLEFSSLSIQLDFEPQSNQLTLQFMVIHCILFFLCKGEKQWRYRSARTSWRRRNWARGRRISWSYDSWYSVIDTLNLGQAS